MCFLFFFFFKQKTAYEMRISDWSSDVCSSDLCIGCASAPADGGGAFGTDIGKIICVPARSAMAEVQSKTRHRQQQQFVTDKHRHPVARAKIGRASCRERMCKYV